MAKGAPEAGQKKQEGEHGGQPHHAKAEPMVPTSKKGPTQAPGACVSWGCKGEAKRFSFCPEHYEHFKFGLIKKNGEPVPDYEKKFGHWQAYQASQKGKKAA